MWDCFRSACITGKVQLQCRGYYRYSEKGHGVMAIYPTLGMSVMDSVLTMKLFCAFISYFPSLLGQVGHVYGLKREKKIVGRAILRPHDNWRVTRCSQGAGWNEAPTSGSVVNMESRKEHPSTITLERTRFRTLYGVKMDLTPPQGNRISTVEYALRGLGFDTR